MLNGKRVVVVMPAYNAEKTIRKTYDEIPKDIVDDIIVTDDNSRDHTVDVARQLGLTVFVHEQNKGYGGNQKTCYTAALAKKADIVIMLHPDYQYDIERDGCAPACVLESEQQQSRTVGTCN